MKYRNNIDDEFASLFLQELHNTNNEGNNHTTTNTDTNNDPKNLRSIPSTTDIDIMSQCSFEDQSISIIGAASYARYLPLETTFSSSNLLDFNYFEDPNNIELFDSNVDSNVDSNDILSFRTGSNRPPVNFSSMSPEKSNNNCNKNTEETNNYGESKSKEDTPPDNGINPEFTSKVLDLLKLEPVAKAQLDNLDINISANLSGRLYTNPELLKDESNLKQLACYRRNGISVHIDIDISKTQLTSDSILILKLSNSLRKHKFNDENCQFITLTKREEFMFAETVSSNKRRTVLNKTESSFTFDELKESQTKSRNSNILSFTWDQLKFKSATANNRYDAISKFYTVIVEVELTNFSNTENINLLLESHPVIVRGRNPSFYANKGDVLISKMFINEKKMNNRKRNKSETVDDAPMITQIEEVSVDIEDNKDSTNDSITNLTISKDRVQVQDSGSSYQYFPVGHSYYQKPVEVGYFPHHVHHNKQVFEPIYNSKVLKSVQKNSQYKYYI